MEADLPHRSDAADVFNDELFRVAILLAAFFVLLVELGLGDDVVDRLERAALLVDRAAGLIQAEDPVLRVRVVFAPTTENDLEVAAVEPRGAGLRVGVLEIDVDVEVLLPLRLEEFADRLVGGGVDLEDGELREAGAVIFSKTTMPDYGMLSSGLSSFHPLTRNPWDLGKNPGGSSSGAGAAAAAGYGPLHLGTDIGGSVRLPGCWCGLVALKPSLGRIPVDPPYVGRVAGPMTRTVDDAALMMSVLSKPDRRDGMSLPAHDINWKALDKSPRKLRFGLMLDAGTGQALEKPVREVAVKAAKAFEAAGAVVTEVAGILTREMLDGIDDFFRVRLWGDLAKLSTQERSKMLPYILQWAERGAKLTGVEALDGFNQTIAIRAAAAKLFCELDYVISPVAPVVNYPAEFAAPLNDPAKPFEHIGYTLPWNMSENPAISVNGGYDPHGFPIGVQIVGRRFDDIGVLAMAKAFEGLRGPQKPWPSPPSE